MRKLSAYVLMAALAVLGGAAVLFDTLPDTDPVSHAWNVVAMVLFIGSWGAIAVMLIVFFARWLWNYLAGN
jgi:predicted membrane protein